MKAGAGEDIVMIGPRPPSWLESAVTLWPLWLLLCFCALVLWWYLRRRKLRQSVVAPTVATKGSEVGPPLDPRAAWQALQIPETNDRERLLAFCFEVSLLLRYLLAQRWIPGAPHMTTDELARWMQAQSRTMNFSDALIRVLQQLDRAKYAETALTSAWVSDVFGVAQALAEDLLKEPADVTYVAKMASEPANPW